MRSDRSRTVVDAAARVRPSLAARLAQRDRAALAELYDQVAGRAFGLAFRVLGDPQAAEDVVQDGFLWLWEHAERVDGARGSPEALLLTVIHRRAIDSVRRRSHRRRREREEIDFDPVDHEALAILSAVERPDIASDIRASLASLAAEQREAIELAYFAGMTQAEIAAHQEVAVGTVKSRMRLGLARLRSVLGGGIRADL